MMSKLTKKRFVSLFLALVLIVSILPSGVMAQSGISVTIDGERVQFEGQQPVNVDGRVLVPVRGVFEALGFTAKWNSDLRHAVLERESHTIIIALGSTTFTTNGASHVLDVPAQIIGNSTMIPLRAPLESVGYSLTWNGATNTVVISTSGEQLLPQQVANSMRPVNPTTPEDIFFQFLYDFTQNLVRGVLNPVEQLEVIYDFIIRNFAYLDERDGAAIDGSYLPNIDDVPQPPFFGGLQAYIYECGTPIVFYTITGVRRPYSLAWFMFLTGEGDCYDFTALFNLMANIIGFDTGFVTGFYVNLDGRQSNHAWSAIRIDGAWYFFDTQIEASQLQRNRNNANYNPRIWWRQPIDSEQTNQRYVINERMQDFNWAR